ncbi:cell division protein SepF [Candidatus Woesearchaeota archaeon]|nr:cell division protein SepF [Candidatus Woesearchaeota archaeon]
MKKLFEKMRQTFSGKSKDDDVDTDYVEEEYVELDNVSSDDKHSKVIVRPFVINDFSDVKPILDAMRQGYTIGLINIKPLKSKDLVELKRAINKIKKTCDAINGDIAGFGDDYLVVAPSFAEIYRSKDTTEPETSDDE